MTRIETLPIITVLVGLISSMLMGVIKHFSDTVSRWPALAKQAFVIVLAGIMIVGLHLFDLTVVPDVYQGLIIGVIQAIVAGLTGIGLHNVKDGVQAGNTPS